MRVNWLRMNPSKTQVMWLGSRQQLQITITQVTILSSTVAVVNLGVVIDNNFDSRLSVVPVVVFLAAATTPIRTFTNNRHHQNTNPGVYFLSPGLLQLVILWYDRHAFPATAVNTERSS